MDKDAIRHLAYLIWENEDRPQGRQHEHWTMAEERIAAERLEASSGTAKVDTVSRTKSDRASRIKPTASDSVSNDIASDEKVAVPTRARRSARKTLL